ncbi:hypothetical protein E1140_09550 [Fulvivirga lutimaris]|nr:hypothetical protein [Fulvivirga lutimaris]
MRLFITIGIAVLILACSQQHKQAEIKEVSLSGTSKASKWPDKLSAWELFDLPMANLKPAEGVFPYDINSALFSDYAFKARFIKLPKDSAMGYQPSSTLDFPVGSVLIKNFYYPEDFNKPDGKMRILETRLLVHENEGWLAVPYVWNKEQTEAHLEVAGATVAASWKDTKGVTIDLNYSVPNQVQCKSCHERNGKFSPIGPNARQLNRDGQLEQWKEAGLLTGLPENHIPKLTNYNDETALIKDRARAWLEINCAHCHSPEGPAKNTGLYLFASQTDDYKLGLNKPPVAAGRGSGGLKYGIVPGNAENSILYHRIKSLDPGVMMPELGRKMEHKEGVALIKEWIDGMVVN